MRENNILWRQRRGNRGNSNEIDWRIGLYKEFIQFVDETYELSVIYDWDFWGGGTDNYAVTLSQAIRDGKHISIKMIPSKDYHYYASFCNEMNPNRIKDDNEYKEFAGETIDEALKYIHTFLLDNEYERQFKVSPTRFLGNGYDKCFMRIRWAKEELANKLIEEEFKTTV